MTEYEKVKEMINTGDFKQAKILLEELLKDPDIQAEKKDGVILLSLNHIIELYIYSYYFEPADKIECADIPYHEYFRTYGTVLVKMGDFEAAEQAYHKAVEWNPVDLDSILCLGELYKYTAEYEKYLEITRQAYRYCCTRATMARYYRNMGFYYLETKKPELAEVLYIYSNIYYHTENANNELEYIENAMNRKTVEYELKELQERLTENNIFLGPDPDTIGIIYRLGRLLMDDGDLQQAKDCFSIVYDITQDKEIEALLDEIG